MSPTLKRTEKRDGAKIFRNPIGIEFRVSDFGLAY